MPETVVVRGEGDTVEIVDFKTDRKPNVNSAEDRQRIQNYHRQLEVYAHIVEEKFDETVAKIESYKFSNKGVKMCKATCDNCDLRYFCHFK